MTRALLLLSGGMDSFALLNWRHPALAVTIDYGQSAAAAEISASKAQCKSVGVPHEVLSIDCGMIGAGDMARMPAVTASQSLSQHAEWWPYRNQLLITFGAALAIKRGCSTVEIGTVSTDRRHADGRQVFISALDGLLSIQEGKIRLLAPALRMTTFSLVRKARVPLSSLGLCHSCHKGNEACGQCNGCRKQSKVFQQLLMGRSGTRLAE